MEQVIIEVDSGVVSVYSKPDSVQVVIRDLDAKKTGDVWENVYKAKN